MEWRQDRLRRYAAAGKKGKGNQGAEKRGRKEKDAFISGDLSYGGRRDFFPFGRRWGRTPVENGGS